MILAVDEVLMSKTDDYVLSSLSLLRNEKKNNVHVIVSHLSEERLNQLTTASQRPIYFVMLSRLSELAIQKLIEQQKDEDVQQLLKSPAFASLIVDCAGIPRFVEVLFRIAGECKLDLTEFTEARAGLLKAMVSQYQNFFTKLLLLWKSASEGMLFAFGEWAMNKLEGKKRWDELCLNGVLHRLDGGYGFPPLQFYIWHEKRKESPLLAAVLEFLRFDMVGSLVAEGPRFEEQVGALFRILSITRNEMIKREGFVFGSGTANNAKLASAAWV